MSDLFDLQDAAAPDSAPSSAPRPLADRLRPARLEDVIGQSRVLLPEGPLDFFLLASALCVARLVLVEPAPARPVLLWMAAGALGGLAMLSKYFAAFYFLAVFVFLITVARQRRARWGWLTACRLAFRFARSIANRTRRINHSGWLCSLIK